MKKEIAKGKIIRYELKSDAPLLGSFEHFKTPIRVNQYRIEKEYKNNYPSPNPYPTILEVTEIEDATLL